MAKLVFGMLLLFVACAPDAPHENPLDPSRQALGRNGSSFVGQVLMKNEPHSPIDSCLVYLLPEEKFTRTGSDGRFEFHDLLPGEHHITVTREGYDTTARWVNLDTVRVGEVHFYLNGKPFVKEIRIYSEYIDQWWPDPITSMYVEISVGDPDGVSDIRELDLLLPTEDLAFSFSETSRPDSFYLRLDDLDLPKDVLYNLIGKAQYVRMRDASGTEVIDGPHYLIRIITEPPVPESPIGLQSVSPNPELTWSPYSAPFAFQYHVFVFFVNAGIPILIHQSEAIDASQERYTYPDSLASGTYFWTIGVRDELHNFSRSKEATFIVP